MRKLRANHLLALLTAFWPLSAFGQQGILPDESPRNGPEATSKPVLQGVVAYDFDETEVASAFEATVGGEKVRKGAGPRIEDGQLYLLESWWKFTTSVAFAAPADSTTRIVEVAWKMTMNTGTEGAGFAWLDTGKFEHSGAAPETEHWEAPSIPASFGVGFDASNPPNRDPFRGSGNAYDRPQHEVSLHWGGMEIVKRTTPMDFRDEKSHLILYRKP